MDVMQVVESIKDKFAATGSPTQIPFPKKEGTFRAELTAEGVLVSNLGNQPFLPWAAFQEAVCLLIRKGGEARYGNALGGKLGSPSLPLDSIEGHIARVVYGKCPGEGVFRRKTPIAGILIWAGICEHKPGKLVLRMITKAHKADTSEP